MILKGPSRNAVSVALSVMTPPRRLRSRRAFTLVEIMIVVLIIGVLASIAVPNFIRARQTSRTSACLKNLRALDGAKEQWAMDMKKNTGDACVQADLMPAAGTTYLKSWPVCPAGGNYTVAPVGTNPACSYGGTHAIP